MDTSGYIALSRQMGLFGQMDIIANNIANSNTAGYRSERVLFSEYVTNAGEKVSFANDIATVMNTSQGELRKTGRQLDAAIEGTGYFAIDTPLGTRYTRAGNFHKSEDGTLVTYEGYPVQGDITFGETDLDITIREDGTVTVKIPSGQIEERGKITVVKFKNEQLLTKVGDSFYKTDAIPEEASVRADFTIAQGMIENSNVNSTSELTAMIKVNRSVGEMAKMMNDLHELQRRAVSTISQQN